MLENFYIDESGSMTKYKTDININKYFIICVIRAKDKEKLKREYKRFISKNYVSLKSITNNRMFLNNKFKELKGSNLTPDLKKKFVDHFIKKPTYEIYYIKIDNRSIRNNFYANTARAFNYVMKNNFETLTNRNYLSYDDNILHIDERNVKTNARATLEEYLNIELVTGKRMQKSFSVKYYQSENNQIIQLADVFANIYFSYLVTGNYRDELKKLYESGHLKFIFKFPITH